MENNELLEQVRSKAQGWLTESYDAETRAAVQALLDKEDPTELIESFYKDLEFGTGGLRGIMGVGSNRMNIYTVGAATQGLSNYLKKEFTDVEQIKVVIGHDCRNNSRKFAEISADIFSANGIKVYIFESLRPTPEMSYAIRKLGCQSGIILTASHNPKEYNGYKAYWNDGAQMITPHDKNTIAEVNKIRSAADINFKGNPALIETIGEEIDKAFVADLKTVSLSPESIQRHNDMKIVAGTGRRKRRLPHSSFPEPRRARRTGDGRSEGERDRRRIGIGFRPGCRPYGHRRQEQRRRMGIAQWKPDRAYLRILPHHALERVRQNPRQGIHRQDHRDDRDHPHDRRAQCRRVLRCLHRI